MTRGDLRKVRSALSLRERGLLSEAIASNLLSWAPLRAASSVMLYRSVGAEVETSGLIRSLLDMRKSVLLPRCLGDGIMEAVPWDGQTPLKPGLLSIPEPTEGSPVDRGLIDMILVPGLAFDRYGNRIGQGGGYYDRFLSGYKGIRVGIAFAVQVVPALSPAPHDVPMDFLATETGVSPRITPYQYIQK